MQTQFKKGVLELCVLSLLKKQDYYGYELVSTISVHMDLSEGTVYPLLYRLKKDGLCLTYFKDSSGGPMRKYYQITPEGKAKQKQLEKQWHEFNHAVTQILKQSERKT
jgi:PadR family transcriptional regulator PadR